MKKTLLIFFLSLLYFLNFAQTTPFILRGALKESRQQLYRSLLQNSITKNLSPALNESTENQWQSAFEALELIGYKSAWVDNKIYSAFDDIQKKNLSFQRALLELAYANYPGIFFKPVKDLLLQTNDAKIFAMCAVYILSGSHDIKEKKFISEIVNQKLAGDKENPIFQQLEYQIKSDSKNFSPPQISRLLKAGFLPGNILMISFQRKNRNYPGIVIVRDSIGNFIKDSTGNIFYVPQLARSISNLPGYLTNGNTPEGVFRMDGFDTSQSMFIGPTTNVQLTMPFEYKAPHFFKDSTLADSIWTIDLYQKLLPADLKNFYPLYESYYAGKAGRTEIIAHGTTIDPAYYQNKPYYPQTPTQGCLCCKEIWNEANGRLMESDQQKLVDAIIKAGGPNGYAIVINIDDQQKPVSIDEIVSLLGRP